MPINERESQRDTSYLEALYIPDPSRDSGRQLYAWKNSREVAIRAVELLVKVDAINDQEHKEYLLDAAERLRRNEYITYRQYILLAVYKGYTKGIRMGLRKEELRNAKKKKKLQRQKASSMAKGNLDDASRTKAKRKPRQACGKKARSANRLYTTGSS